MSNYPREMSCYGTALLIEYSKKRGFNEDFLFRGIEEHKNSLANSQEWINLKTIIRFLDNFKHLGGDLFPVGLDLTLNQVSQFQLMILKVAPVSFLNKRYPVQF